jgi:hypothetical protein
MLETGALFKRLNLIIELLLSFLLWRQTLKARQKPSLPPSQPEKDSLS